MINLSNYETWLLQYADGECSPAEQRAVEHFLQLHPALQEELNGMMALRFEPDLHVHFPEKSLLYRKQRSKMVYLYRAVAAAAVLLISFGLYQLLSADQLQQSAVVSSPVADPVFAPMPVPEKSVLKAADQNGSRTALAAKAKPQANPPVVTPAVVEEPVTETYSDVVAQTDIIAPMQEEKKPLSNLSEELRKAAAVRMEASLVATPAAASLNSAVLIRDATKPREKKPLRSLIRTLTRGILHDSEENEEGQIIQVANFHIHIKN